MEMRRLDASRFQSLGYSSLGLLKTKFQALFRNARIISLSLEHAPGLHMLELVRLLYCSYYLLPLSSNDTSNRNT